MNYNAPLLLLLSYYVQCFCFSFLPYITMLHFNLLTTMIYLLIKSLILLYLATFIHFSPALAFGSAILGDTVL